MPPANMAADGKDFELCSGKFICLGRCTKHCMERCAEGTTSTCGVKQGQQAKRPREKSHCVYPSVDCILEQSRHRHNGALATTLPGMCCSKLLAMRL
eukprot:5119728-Amphidinium_carterae.1